MKEEKGKEEIEKRKEIGNTTKIGSHDRITGMSCLFINILKIL